MGKLICIGRDAEETKIKKELDESKIVIYNTYDKSGITFFLKDLSRKLQYEGKLAFYVNASSEFSISDQIVSQIVKSEDIKKLKKSIQIDRGIKDTILSFLQPLVLIGDSLPVPVGSIANALFDEIIKTIDVDIKHAKDYKLEKAVILLMNKYSFYIIIDEIEEINKSSLEFLTTVVNETATSILYAPNINKKSKMNEIISKTTRGKVFPPSLMDTVFNRPNDDQIKAIFECYNRIFSYDYIQCFEMSGRSIHAIMARINGIDEQEIFTDIDKLILIILHIAKHYINFKILEHIILNNNEALNYNTHEKICKSINMLETRNLVHTTKDEVKIINESYDLTNIEITPINQKKYTNDLVNAFTTFFNLLNESNIKFAISELSRDYAQKKKYILKLLELQNLEGRVDVQYLDMIFVYEDLNELLLIMNYYYNQYNYKSALSKLCKEESLYGDNRKFKIIKALLLERLHQDNYHEVLKELVDSSTEKEEKVLLLTVFFVATLNSTTSKEYKIFLDKDNKYYYKNFIDSDGYFYLLRNISFYLDNVIEGIKQYRQCLNHFKNSDTINYSRTISNFLAYLIKHRNTNQSSTLLNDIGNEANEILKYYDERYYYLNINYGLYLMMFTDEDPTNYFEIIERNQDTTETPYIYAQINLAIYNSYTNLDKANEIINDIEILVERTTVPRTKQFFYHNKALIDCINGNFNQESINKMLEFPLRGNEEFAKEKIDTLIRYTKIKEEISKQLCIDYFLPGFIFYRYFDISLLI